MAKMTLSQHSERKDYIQFALIALVVLTSPIWMTPLGGYYGLLQKFAIFGIFAVGYNILFGFTGYLSFGHAAFLGVGSYAACWSFKLLSLNVLPAIAFAVVVSGAFALFIGFICLRRTGIYFSILTLALAQMCYNLAYSVLTPITNGETGLRVLVKDPRYLDSLFGIVTDEGSVVPNFFGLKMIGSSGFYFTAFFLLLGYYIAMRISRSDFGLILQAIKSNQNRLNYAGFSTRPYTLSAFVISGMYAGLAGALLVVTDPLAGAERMQWTASGEVVLMTILGGAGTLLGPMLGASVIKYFENIFQQYNEQVLLNAFAWLPESLQHFFTWIVGPFVGEGWHLTLGVLFMVIIIALPGGLVQGAQKIASLFRKRDKPQDHSAVQAAP